MSHFTSWSFSSLDTYRGCPLRAKLRYIDRIPDPGNKYSERGNEMHDALEQCVVHGAPVPDWAAPFNDLLLQMQQSNPICEKMFMFDSNWKPTDDHKNAWLRIKQDLVVVADDFGLTVDYKSGKKYGNEIKHLGQKMLYSIGAMIMWPGRKDYIGEMWYLDQKDLTSKTFDVPTLEKARARLDAEVGRMFEDKYFRPRPTIGNCKYCPYGPRGTGHCPVGV